MEEPMEGFDPDAWADLVRSYREDLVDKMTDSALVLSIVPTGEPDLKLVIETGLAVLLDKPIVLVLQPGAEPSENMRRLARGTVFDIDTEEGQRQLRAVLGKFSFGDPE
jgi:hypothetical protein